VAIRGQVFTPKIRMRLEGQPPSSRIARVFPLSFCHRGGAASLSSNDCFSPTALASEYHICRSQPPVRHPETTNRQPSRYCQQFRLLRKAGSGRRPQRPGNQSRLRACLEVPPGGSLARFTGSLLALPQSFSELRERSRFAEPTLPHFVALRNRKTRLTCAHPVDDLSSLWNPEEISDANPFSPV
jgi:hypothetical protein